MKGDNHLTRSTPLRHVNQLLNLKQATRDTKLVSWGENGTSPHQLYKYPARFSPRFAAAAIELISEPRDLICDPFMGGGTTIIEALRHGRRALGVDVSPLSNFLIGSFMLSTRDNKLDGFETWFRLNLNRNAKIVHQLSIDDSLPQKNLELGKSWRHLRLISTLLEIGSNDTPSHDRLMRLVVLKGCQWAFDLRTVIPPFREFVDYLDLTAKHILTTCHAYREFMNEEWGGDWYTGLKGLHQGSIATIVDCDLRRLHGKVDAIVTSPPYPGVHMLYGRWQVFGRRETELPLWIIGTSIRPSEGSYTMHSRRDTDNSSYFAMLHESMRAARMLLKSEGYMIQMAGFSEPSVQLPKFIHNVESSGFAEVRSKRLSTARDGRLWRAVPNRKWYTKSLGNSTRTKSEVVLIFRAARTRYL